MPLINNYDPARAPLLERNKLLRAPYLERRFLIRTKTTPCKRLMAVLTTFELEYVIRGYNEYKRVWTPVLNEMLSTEVETANPHDIHAVGIVPEELCTVGHVPKKTSRLCHSFLTRNGVLKCGFWAVGNVQIFLMAASMYRVRSSLLAKSNWSGDYVELLQT